MPFSIKIDHIPSMPGKLVAVIRMIQIINGPHCKICLPSRSICRWHFQRTAEICDQHGHSLTVSFSALENFSRVRTNSCIVLNILLNPSCDSFHFLFLCLASFCDDLCHLFKCCDILLVCMIDSGCK